MGLLESRERFAVWRVRQAADLPAAVKALARGLCLFEGHAAVATDRLAAGEWPAAVERIERIVFENSRIALGKDIDELVIVPDGWLWYVPFELLPVATNRAEGAGGEVVRLRDTCRLRYAPTRSLAVMETQPLPPGLVGVVAGRMSRADRPQTAEEAFAHLAAAIDRVVPLPAAAFGLSASTVDTLVVFEELSATGPSAARPLIAGAAGKHGVSFAEWLAPPPKRVRRCVLPGMQTAMADGFQSPPERPGDEAFSAAMDLLAAGAQTAVLSRWRTGGKTAMDLVTEFVRDATGPDGQPAAESWRRAVDVVLAEQFDPQREPRLRHAAPAAVPHPPPPLLWAGYMLIDCGAGPAAAAGQPPQGKP